MHPNEQLIQRFYEAFARRDAEAMAACYHRDVEFSDPVFPDLRGDEARDMWRMLAGRAADLEVRFEVRGADDRKGAAHWDADYTFSKTGRKVNNRIDAEFEFEDGLIRRHTDHFDLWRWSRMALGTPGLVLGWSPVIGNAVRKEAAKGLAAFRRKAGRA
ncbi:MAG: nuclear transport factor 2 family protein [Proteobacteria bacterium]|nr:nuclear transport factor 2 family protein [Pseudomonadota bacterium]